MPKTQPLKPERRYLAQEFRVSQEGEVPKVAGHAAVFDSPSEDMGFIEEIDPHAFDSLMAGSHDCRALWNHNDDVVLGRESAGTLRLSIDARGLAYEVDLPDTQAARDLLVSMRRKDVRESSFGFICKRDLWTEMPDGSIRRRILEFDELLDVSPVTYPAFTATSAGVRNLPNSCPTEIRSKISKRMMDGDVDPNQNDCECPCPECQDNDCDNCSANDCTDPNCLANQRSHTPGASKRGLGLGCTCGCPQCVSGACGICSKQDCNDPECACLKERSKPVSAEERQRMEMQLALLTLQK